MIRYWAASIFLHLTFYAALTWKPTSPIEDPIVGVTLVESSSRLESSTSAKPSLSSAPNPMSQARDRAKTPPEPKQALSNPTLSQTSFPNENELKDPSSSEENTSNDGMGAVEADIGTVSVRPRVLRQFKVDYPSAAKAAGIEGAVKLSVLIDANGKVQDVGVIEGPGYGLNETAQQAMRKFVFSPAEKLGEKVPVRIVYIYRFRLESR